MRNGFGRNARCNLGAFAGNGGLQRQQQARRKIPRDHNQNSEDVGDSWRYYIRPRKGACLTQKGTNIVGTSAVPYMVIHPGSKNCSAKYKSYVTIPVPKPTTQSGTPVLTTLYVTIGNTKAHATSDGPGGYGTEINFQPFTRADGTPGMNVVAVCFR